MGVYYCTLYNVSVHGIGVGCGGGVKILLDQKLFYSNIFCPCVHRVLHWVSPGLRRRHLEYHLKVQMKHGNLIHRESFQLVMLGSIFSICIGLYWLRQIQGRIRLRNEEALKNCNKHFGKVDHQVGIFKACPGKWLLLHLLRLNIDRRSFQEIINRLCSAKTAGLQRTLTNISEDFNETPPPINSSRDPSEEVRL